MSGSNPPPAPLARALLDAPVAPPAQVGRLCSDVLHDAHMFCRKWLLLLQQPNPG